MSQGETKAVETTGHKPMILCASQSGTDPDVPTHALRRLDFLTGPLDVAFGGCAVGFQRPFSVFFAPIDEINCPECVAQVLGARKKP